MPSSKGRARAFAAVFVACTCWLGCASQPVEPRNVIFIVIDTLRADMVRPGDPAAPMPFLSELAARSIFYERAHAPSSWTLPSMSSLFLARYPSQHRMGSTGWGDVMPPGVTLAQVLQSHGFLTAARIAHIRLGADQVGRGFDDFRYVPRDAAVLTEAALEWIGAPGRPDAPFFLYLHYIDAHVPLVPHPGVTAERGPSVGRSDDTLGRGTGVGTLVADEAKRRAAWSYTTGEVERIRQLYDGEARYVDQKIEALFQGLAERGELEQSIVVVTSDHGEEFGEHGVFGHGASLYGAVIRVPLLVVLPDGAHARIASPIQTGGLAPTLLAELGIPVPEEFVIPRFPLREEPASMAPVHVDLPIAKDLKLHLHRRGVIDERGKLLVADDGTEHFYRFSADGREVPVPGDLPNAEGFRAALREIGALAVDEPPESRTLDVEQREQLRELGYVQ